MKSADETEAGHARGTSRVAAAEARVAAREEGQLGGNAKQHEDDPSNTGPQPDGDVRWRRGFVLRPDRTNAKRHRPTAQRRRLDR